MGTQGRSYHRSVGRTSRGVGAGVRAGKSRTSLVQVSYKSRTSLVQVLYKSRASLTLPFLPIGLTLIPLVPALLFPALLFPALLFPALLFPVCHTPLCACFQFCRAPFFSPFPPHLSSGGSSGSHASSAGGSSRPSARHSRAVQREYTGWGSTSQGISQRKSKSRSGAHRRRQGPTNGGGSRPPRAPRWRAPRWGVPRWGVPRWGVPLWGARTPPRARPPRHATASRGQMQTSWVCPNTRSSRGGGVRAPRWRSALGWVFLQRRGQRAAPSPSPPFGCCRVVPQGCICKARARPSRPRDPCTLVAGGEAQRQRGRRRIER